MPENNANANAVSTLLNSLHGRDIKRAVETFEASHAAGASIDELFTVASELMRMAPTSPIIIPAGHMSLYRVRRFAPEEPCVFVKDMHYPPPGIASEGRANRKGRQVLYVATGPVVAVKEARIEVGEQFVLTEYAIKENLGLLHAGVYSSPERDWISEMGKNISNVLGGELNVFGRQNLHEAHRWLGELFLSQDRTRYPMSIAIAEILLSPVAGLGPVDGFIFPSLFESRQYNIVFTTAAADRKLAPVRFWRGLLRGHEPINGEDGIQSFLFDHAIEVDGESIIWTGNVTTPDRLPPH